MHKFWMVWRDAGHPPTHKHDSQEGAEKEAERLARTCPGERFFVLEAISVSCKVDVITRSLGKVDDDIPF